MAVCEAFGIAAAGCVTALTDQDTASFRGVHTISSDWVTRQLCAAATGPIDGIKIGALGGRESLSAVLRFLDSMAAKSIKVVIDPVMLATTGGDLTGGDRSIYHRLLTYADVITPNRREAEWLVGATASLNIDELGAALLETGPTAAVITDSAAKQDWLVTSAGVVALPYVDPQSIDCHGTGCVFAAALTAYLVMGQPLTQAATHAQRVVTDAMKRSKMLDIGGRRLRIA